MKSVEELEKQLREAQKQLREIQDVEYKIRVDLMEAQSRLNLENKVFGPYVLTEGEQVNPGFKTWLIEDMDLEITVTFQADFYGNNWFVEGNVGRFNFNIMADTYEELYPKFKDYFKDYYNQVLLVQKLLDQYD